MALPEHIHFFSWETRVSIELPLGFEEQIEDPDTHSAIYADDLDAGDGSDDGDDSPGARVMTKMTAVPDSSPEAYRAVARASAGGPAAESAGTAPNAAPDPNAAPGPNAATAPGPKAGPGPNAAPRTVRYQRDCEIDGAPAVRQVLTYHDQDAGIDVVRHETFAQLADVVFSITCLAPASREAEYLPAFDHAADSARFILIPAGGASS